MKIWKIGKIENITLKFSKYWNENLATTSRRNNSFYMHHGTRSKFPNQVYCTKIIPNANQNINMKTFSRENINCTVVITQPSCTKSRVYQNEKSRHFKNGI